MFCPGGTGGGAYTIEVEPQTIRALTLEESTAFDLEHQGTAYAHLELARGQEVWLSARGGTRCDTAITILAPDGQQLGPWEGGGIGSDALAAFAAPVAGRYTVMLHSRAGSGRCDVRALVP